jgi:glycolate oxidase iron-sulfur subunit
MNESHSPRGFLMLLRNFYSGVLPASGKLSGRLMSCALCGLCDASCPTGLKPSEFVYAGRAALRKAYWRKFFLIRTSLKVGLRHPAIGLKLARLAGLELPRYPLRDELHVIKPQKTLGRVAVFAGCGANYLMPPVGISLINILTTMGYEVVLPRGEVCCGAPLRGLGLKEDAESFAHRNMEAFGRLNVEAVLSPCPTCAHVLREQYKALIGEGIEKAAPATQFIAAKLKEKIISGSAGWQDRKLPFTKLLWHEPCHLKYGLGFDSSALLELLGIRRAPEGCCGFGLFLTDRKLSEKMRAERARALQGADTVVTSCPSCIIQLGKAGIKTAHIVEIIEEAFF